MLQMLLKRSHSAVYNYMKGKNHLNIRRPKYINAIHLTNFKEFGKMASKLEMDLMAIHFGEYKFLWPWTLLALLDEKN